MFEWTRMSEVLELRREAAVATECNRYTNIGVRGFGRGIFSYPEVHAADLPKLRFFHLDADRLVVSNIKGWEGAVAVTTSEESGRIASSRFLTYAAPDPHRVSLRYVAHWLLSAAGLEVLGRASPGSADRNRTLSIKNFEAIEVPLPDIKDQRRIAAYLDKVERRAAHAELGPKRALGALREQVVERAARTGVRTRLGSMVSIERDWFAVDPDASYNPIGVRGFGRGMIRYPAVRGEQLSKLRYYSVVPGRLVISNIKAWEGAVTTSSESDGCRVASNRFLQYRVTEDRASLAWLYLYLTSAAGTRALAAASPGSADRNRTLSMATFEALDVPVPDLEVQNNVEAIASRIEAGENASGRAELLQQALLPAARNEIFSSMR